MSGIFVDFLELVLKNLAILFFPLIDFTELNINISHSANHCDMMIWSK